MLEQAHGPATQAAADPAQGFDAGSLIIGHVSNSPLDHPLIHLPPIFGIDMSVTKHVLMLWIVAAIVFFGITTVVRRYLKQDRLVPSGFMNALEAIVEFLRDDVALASIGKKWALVWTPLLLTLFFFILASNVIGLIPIFDALALLNHYVFHPAPDSFLAKVTHGGATATGNFNVTAGLAVISFFAIITAGTRAHGFIQHWINLVPHGQPWPIYILLIPLEIIGMLVRPFALTARLAANMTGGHITLLAIMSFVFIFTEMLGTPVAGISVGMLFSVPLAVAISGLEIIVVLVQAYVFTLLSAVFIGMAINAHH